ncbi:MAG: UDP-N-acetylmuramoyl-L-alanyl-D-glutamate--2,6-diaminopimelate ligase, partial [Deltaproteobacteria bacterium]|nr:UDP-N-acetylmuramoyl-L-alanyl-D-glutamate--2,6-diaminopimelate ligase [Deltaproteobacteria bacterium]
KEMADAGVTHLAMEVSSHALDQKRVSISCRFDAAVFTNLTHEHLDYHGTMEEYFRCKSILFERLLREPGKSLPVVNIDDPWGRRLASVLSPALTYSLKKGADVYPEGYSYFDDRTEAVIVTPQGKLRLSSHLVGEYNLSNILASVAAGSAIGLPLEAIGRGVEGLRRVPGRLEKIESPPPIDSIGGKRFLAYVDYAHTGDALLRVLGALKSIAKGRVITVFGCGGNRDRMKRPVMGEIAARMSDVTIITSDNPRDEDPLDIIREVEAGIKGVKRYGADEPVKGKGFISIPDRREAVRKAVSIAGDNDTILVAGKGHEECQIVRGNRTHFNDTEEIKDAMDEFCGRKAAIR